MIDKKIPYYSCGATVYKDPHIGNYRAIGEGLKLARANKKRVLLNITDIDDKILSLKGKQKLNQFTNNIIRKHVKILKELGFDQSFVVIKRWSLNAPKLYDLLCELDKKEKLLKVNDGYTFNCESKFYVWKARAPGDDCSLNFRKYGNGVAGWHSECATLINAYCSKNLTHTGGEDLLLHHTNEELQLKQLGFHIRWKRFPLLHSELKDKEQKMSKSKDNSIMFSNIPEFNRFLYDKILTLKKISRVTLDNLYTEWKHYVIKSSTAIYNTKNKKEFNTLKTKLKKEAIIPLSFLKKNKKILKLRKLMDAARGANNYSLSDKLRKIIKQKGFNAINASDSTTNINKIWPRLLQEKEA